MFKTLPEGILFSFYVVRMVVELGHGYPLMFEMCKHQPQLLLCAKEVRSPIRKVSPEGSEHITPFMLHARADLSKTERKREQKRICGDQELGNYGDVVSLHFCSYFWGGSPPTVFRSSGDPIVILSHLDWSFSLRAKDLMLFGPYSAKVSSPPQPQQCLGTSRATPSHDQGTIWCQRLNPDYV